MLEHHNNALLRLGVNSPEQWTENLSDEAVTGVIAWARDENRRGRAPTSAQICLKMKNGGLAGYGLDSNEVKAWYRTYRGRERWLEQNLPAEDPIYAEAAIISLVCQKREPSAQTVKSLAFQLEMEQAEHDELCKKSVRSEVEAGTA